MKKLNDKGRTTIYENKINGEEVSLKGTFVSVMLLGGFLALAWLGVFILFIGRS